MAPRRKRECVEKKKSNNCKKLKLEEVFNAKRCTSWFEYYSKFGNSDANTIGPEGIEKLCTDLNVPPEDVALLVIAWKMDAQQMGFFSKQEWLKGFSDLQCDSNAKLSSKINHLKNILQENFRSIYRYSYDFARDKDKRSLDTDIAIELLRLLLGNTWKLYPQFQQFLLQSKYKVINKDQWCNILEFSRTITSDLSNYDLDGACTHL